MQYRRAQLRGGPVERQLGFVVPAGAVLGDHQTSAGGVESVGAVRLAESVGVGEERERAHEQVCRCLGSLDETTVAAIASSPEPGTKTKTRKARMRTESGPHWSRARVSALVGCGGENRIGLSRAVVSGVE